MDFIKNLDPILICDIGASACDPTSHLEDLLNNTKSLLYGFEPNKDEYLKLTNGIDSTKKKLLIYIPFLKCGRSSVVERLVANEKVVGSSPIARSILI